MNVKFLIIKKRNDAFTVKYQRQNIESKFRSEPLIVPTLIVNESLSINVPEDNYHPSL